MGSPRFRTEGTRTALTTQAWFAPGSTLHPHTHERTIFAVMLDGSFETAVARRRLDCMPGAVWTEPAEERHANYVGACGARVLVVQPDPARDDVFEPFLPFLSEVHLFRHPGIVGDARRISSELAHRDSLSPLAIDALIVGMLSAATRLAFADAHHARRPAWLTLVQEFLHANVGRDVSLAALAAVGGVHPSHLAHAFRRFLGMSVGAYARQLRLEAALGQLSETDAPISEIAMATGFADQSHLTRACRAVLGITPREYRRRRADHRSV
jgi:AraC family transcriptional regulator